VPHRAKAAEALLVGKTIDAMSLAPIFETLVRRAILAVVRGG